MKDFFEFENDSEVRHVLGVLDRNIPVLEDRFGVVLSARGRELRMKGGKKAVSDLKKFLREYLKNGNGSKISPEMRDNARHGHKARGDYSPSLLTHGPKKVMPKTAGQEKYLEAIHQSDIVFGLGPAGTGKTYLAMAAALDYFKADKVDKIILSRPVVEAGEKLGFLPGDLHAKINPYLRPLLDALHDLVAAEEIAHHIEKGKIEITPLAYMRGRTFHRSFIILDEAQNTTPLQMKMFLTRLGKASKMVITGDVTQIDFPSPKHSGLLHAQPILKKVPEIKTIWLNETDVMRHPLVVSILKAYEQEK